MVLRGVVVLVCVCMSCSGKMHAGSLSFSRPGVVFLPSSAEVRTMQNGKPAGRWRGSELSVVLRLDSAKEGQGEQRVGFSLVRDGTSVALNVLTPDQRAAATAEISPDVHTSLTLVIPPETLLQWKATQAVETSRDWKLYLNRTGEARGVLVGTVRVVHLTDGKPQMAETEE